MTELISTLQEQSIDEALIYLFELGLDDTTTVFFHSGFNFEDNTQDFNVDPRQYAGTVQFKARGYSTDPVTQIINTYIPIPAQLEGMEFSKEGPSNRPKLAIANILDTFSEELGGLSNDELLGKRIVVRTTLLKYLMQSGGPVGALDQDDGAAPLEFPTSTYIIDRVSLLNSALVEFELANPLDLPNITLPNRMVVGKYCSWKYQGKDTNNVGACSWKADHTNPFYPASRTARFFYNLRDEPICWHEEVEGTYTEVSDDPLPTSGRAVYSISTDYVTNDIVKVVIPNTSPTEYVYYVATRDIPAGLEPGTRRAFKSWVPIRPYYRWSLNTQFNYYPDDPFRSDYVLYPSGGTEYPGTGMGQGLLDPKSNNGVPTIWRCKKSHTSGNADILRPRFTSPYWERAELCGKTLESCKLRYQATRLFPRPNSSFDGAADWEFSKPGYKTRPNYAILNNTIALPFGAFPGTVKF
jgi:lambda family phage minor tail protein L